MWPPLATAVNSNNALGQTHTYDGQFDQDKTLALFEGVVRDAKRQGFPLIRFVTHMEWALENNQG